MLPKDNMNTASTFNITIPVISSLYTICTIFIVHTTTGSTRSDTQNVTILMLFTLVVRVMLVLLLTQ